MYNNEGTNRYVLYPIYLRLRAVECLGWDILKIEDDEVFNMHWSKYNSDKLKK